ncbi:uncharacterized protein LOC141838196 [Curcuma longa]|uniref:uncharacterized protein LOC141838196 n=1 Tax=Curcuma longa TaxID=136217 RepID=UPI003D9EA2FD
MEFLHRCIILLVLLGVLFTGHYEAQSPGSSTDDARSLDTLLQDYAYRALVHPRTGFVYDGTVPSNLTGIRIAAIRLRSGSLRRRGVERYKEFGIPSDIVVQPYVERLVLVYQNLGNWSSFYYPLPGFTYLTPVLGLLAYDGTNLSATNLPKLDFAATNLPVSINFSNVVPVPSGVIARCVWFGLNGSPDFRDLESRNKCSVFRQGHFSIVVNSSEIVLPPAPSEGPGLSLNPVVSRSNKSKLWKIIVVSVVGVIALVLLALLILLMLKYTRNKKVAKMEQLADAGVSLHTASVGNARVPVASGLRTQPILENELVA